VSRPAATEEAAAGHAARPALLAIAHGSRDPRHAAALHGLIRAVRRAAPGLRAELAFLDLCGPDTATALARLDASGAGEVVVVPLFLSRGYHVQHDIPAVTEHALGTLRRPPRLSVSDPLGPDPLVLDALDRRLREQDVWPADPTLGLVLASATSPAAADEISALRARGRTDIAVASYFLAPGLLHDRVRADAHAAGVPVAAPLTNPDDEPPTELVRLVLSRHAAAASALSARADALADA
jgi:sirohydrochlorin ferrochelatase